VDFICFLLSEFDIAFFHIPWNDSFLCEEWKKRHPDNSLDDKFLQMSFVSLEVSFLQTNLTISVELFIDFCFSFPFFSSCLSRRMAMIVICFCFTMRNFFWRKLLSNLTHRPPNLWVTSYWIITWINVIYSLILNFNDIILTLQFNLYHFNLYFNQRYC